MSPSPTPAADAWLDEVVWNEQGLVPAIAQDAASGRVLMLAWVNREALCASLAEGRAVYWSRARGCLWRKGEQSGHVQHIRRILLDCDGDSLLYVVDQTGGIACHTGRPSCFFRSLGESGWREIRDSAGNTREVERP